MWTLPNLERRPKLLAGLFSLAFPTDIRKGSSMDDQKSISRIVELATAIKHSVAKIQDDLDALGALSPTFHEDAPPIPVEVHGARDVVLDATMELHDLLTDPMNTIHRSARVRHLIPVRIGSSHLHRHRAISRLVCRPLRASTSHV
jgi:hypothetical protein